MRILLDESLPRGLKGLLEGIDEVVTLPEQGWQSMKNGELLRLASGAFDVFVTADQNLEYQQDIASLPLAVVVLVARSNRLEAYVPLAKKLREAVKAGASWNRHKRGRLTMQRTSYGQLEARR